MAGFDAIYKQTVTLFNRVKSVDGDVMWYPTVIEGVHLVVDKSASWDNYGGRVSDNVRLHIRYLQSGDDVLIRYRKQKEEQEDPEAEAEYGYKKWYEPKAWRRLADPEEAVTFSYDENDFDFFVEGAFDELATPVSDENFERSGFYNHMNATYDNVFAITGASKYNLIPHFELTAR